MPQAATFSLAPLRLVTRAGELRAAIAEARAVSRGIGLVPTMGALHEGHLSLVRASVAEGRFTVATIFVNPTQFAPGDDFTRYPRNLEQDLLLLASAGAELAFAPEASDVFPAGFSTYIDPPQVALPLEGQYRPGHFRGVATIVLKLFNLVGADAAFFGHKDYQQSLVVRRMAQELNVPTEIRVCPTIREPDGLALSSRNVYLSPLERGQAVALSQSLFAAQKHVADGERDPSVVLRRMHEVLLAAQIERVDYVTLANPETLEDVADLARPAIALVAAHVGRTRLIDNLRLGG